MHIARRMAAIPPSPTLAITAKAKALAKAGVDVVSFGAGEPDFDTPDFIKQAAKDALDQGVTRYTPVQGTPELRAAAAAYLETYLGLRYHPDEIIFSCGGKHSLYNVFACLLEPGDEVVIPAPYWVSYPVMVQLAGGSTHVISTTADQGFKITPEQLEAAINEKTRAFVLNSPSNPTGAGYSPAEIDSLAAVLRRHPEVVIISDDIYHKLTYDGFEFRSIAACGEDLKQRTLLVNGLSKTYSMTGWRIGFTAGDKAFVGAMTALQSQSTSNIASFAQSAAVVAMTHGDDFLDGWLREFSRRRTYIVEALNAIEGVRCNRPDGAFYVFPDIAGVVGRRFQGRVLDSDLAIADYLLEHANVAVVPGVAFGAPSSMRLSYATSMAQIEKGLTRIRQAFDSLD
ncbi:MAG: pyridoxal phosphate-dependent aminotransferase [Myxococcales bacterium]|nr:pyridoxal phosphate-dependent aminotransferase [Myxococcales bacterium]